MNQRILDNTRIIVNFIWVIFIYSFMLHMHDSGKHWRWNKNWTLPILSPLLFGLCTFPFRFHHHFAHLITEIFTAALGTIFPLPLCHESWFMQCAFPFWCLLGLLPRFSTHVVENSWHVSSSFFFLFQLSIAGLSDFSVQKELVHSRRRINKGPRKHKRIAPITHASAAAYNTSTYHLHNHDKPSNQIALAHNMLRVILSFPCILWATPLTSHTTQSTVQSMCTCSVIQPSQSKGQPSSIYDSNQTCT